MIELEFLTDDSDKVELAKRYWSLTPDGKFAHPAASLLPFGPVSTTGQLASLMRSIVVAKNLKLRCPRCQNLDVIAARSQFRPRANAMASPCLQCKAHDALAKQAATVSAAQALQLRLHKLAEQKLSVRIDFDALPDHIAFVLLALAQAISPRLGKHPFTQDDCCLIAPTNVDGFIEKLVECNAIIVRPDLCPPGTYLLEGDQLSYYPSRAVYQLTTATTPQSPEAVTAGLRQRSFSESPALADLWLDFAAAECVRYMRDQAKAHSLPVDRDLERQIFSTVRVAAETYSVAEIWNVIWKVVRDAASLSRRDYYNPSKAAVTLPGKIKRLIEKVKRGEASIKPWNRPDLQPSGTLGDLFVEMFGIDENTSGTHAMALLMPPADTSASESPDHADLPDRNHANMLFLAALGHGATIEVLAAFTEAVVNGYSTSDAISHVYEIHPYLSEPY